MLPHFHNLALIYSKIGRQDESRQMNKDCIRDMLADYPGFKAKLSLLFPSTSLRIHHLKVQFQNCGSTREKGTLKVLIFKF